MSELKQNAKCFKFRKDMTGKESYDDLFFKNAVLPVKILLASLRCLFTTPHRLLSVYCMECCCRIGAKHVVGLKFVAMSLSRKQ